MAALLTPLRMLRPLLWLVVAMWAAHVLNISLEGELTRTLGLVPRTLGGLDGIVAMPFLHGNWEHLSANTGPLLVLGSLIVLLARDRFVAVTIGCVVLCGVLTWLFARQNNHIGASGLVFAWFAFLVAWGVIERSWRALLGAAVALVLYGAPTWLGIVGTDERVSWDGHLAGLVAGGLVAWRVPHRRASVSGKRRRNARSRLPRPQPWHNSS
ncbi:MAG: rhomboid family intramembrane serine protease [Pseudomonadota bacterium]